MSAFRATARRYTARVGAPAPAQLQRRRAAGTRAYAAAETSEPGWTKSTLPGPPPLPPTEAAPAEAAPAAAAAGTATSAWSKRVFQDAVKALAPRNDWTREEVSAVYHQPLMELVQQASTVHRRFHSPGEVQLCTLMNIKTGGCTEDCKYCAQSTRYQAGTGLEARKTESVEAVLAAARAARDQGSTRFCMGAAWRDMRGRKNGLRNIIDMVTGVRALGLEACVTLGMVDADQARALKAAGLTAYNHNVDTSREFYPSVISTRTYDERLATLANVRDAGIHVCSGGIVGLGEEARDRIGLLHTVSTLPQHPESFPVNALVPIPGTPLGDTPPLPFGEVLRTVATARILMPATIVRLAAGRKAMAEERQALCFLAGANAVFTGEKMLTTECNGYEEDRDLFARWGLLPMKSFHKRAAPAEVEE